MSSTYAEGGPKKKSATQNSQKIEFEKKVGSMLATFFFLMFPLKEKKWKYRFM